MDEKEMQNQNTAGDGAGGTAPGPDSAGQTAEKAKKKKSPLKIIVIVIIILVCIAVIFGVAAVSQKSGAETAALRHAGVTEAEVSGLHSDLELEGLTPVSDVSFWTQDAKYEYEVTAFGHEIRQFEREPLANAGQSGSSSQNGTQPGTSGAAGTQQGGASAESGMIDGTAAMNAALSHAGLTEADIYGYQSWLDSDHGTQIYEIEFRSGNSEYEYEINAYSGEVLKFESDRDHH